MMTRFTRPTLDLDLEVLDAEGLSKGLYTGESLHITFANGRYWLKSRTFNYDVDWDTHFEVSLDQARRIVEKGYADWWFTVDPSVR